MNEYFTTKSDDLSDLGGAVLHGSEMGGVNGKLLTSLIDDQVLNTPESIAVVFEDRQLSFRQLKNKADLLAGYLTHIGVCPGDIIGLYMERSLELVISMLGIMKTGGTYLPLDTGYPMKRLEFMLEDSGAKVILAQEAMASSIPASESQILYVDRDWDIISKAGFQPGKLTVSPEDPVYLIYTSGSSGIPKGVLIPHRSIVNHMLWMQERFPVDASDRILQKTPFSADASVWEFFLPLMSGAQLILADVESHWDMRSLAEQVIQREITIVQFVPSVLRLFIEIPLVEECVSLRRVFAGGEALSPEVVRKVHEQLSVDLINLYGPTETTIDSTFWVTEKGSCAGRIPIGKPIANTVVYVLDDQLQPVAAGESGELCIAGMGVGIGYLDRQDLTREKFVPNPYSPIMGDRLYRTGDKCRIRMDGCLEFLGRLDQQIQIRGFRIELEEVEHVLSGAPGVGSCIAVGREFGKDKLKLVGYVKPSSEAVLNLEAIKEFMADNLPEHFVPNHLVEVDDWPLLPNGKIDREALPIPSHEIRDDHASLPKSELEERLVDIFREVLGWDSIGRKEDFFNLGGHSILALQLVSRIELSFGLVVPVKIVYSFPTVMGLARWIEDSGMEFFPENDGDLKVGASKESPDGKVAKSTTVSKSRREPLSYSQQGLWFLDQLGSGSPEYNISNAIQLKGDLEIDNLKAALNLVVSRHETLRTTFDQGIDGPFQVIHPEMNIPLEELDLSGDSSDLMDEELENLLKKISSHIFDLKSGPLMRMVLIRRDSTDHVLVSLFHHIISDGWSMGLFWDEVGIIYSAGCKKIQPEVEPLDIQYADYCKWQKEYLQGEVLQEQLEFWVKRLKNSSVLDLPTDFPRKAVQTRAGESRYFNLSDTLSRKIDAFCSSSGVTAYIALMSAFQVLMFRYSGDDDILTGTPVANRLRIEHEKLIGYFVNTIVQKTDFSENPSYQQIVDQVFASTMAAFRYHELPFNKLVEALNPQRNLAHHPVYQVTMALQNAPGKLPEMKNLEVSKIPIMTKLTHFDLEMHILKENEIWTGEFVYRTDLFLPATIDRMSNNFHVLLENMLDDPDRPVIDIGMLTHAGTQEISPLEEYSVDSYPRDETVSSLFEEQAKITPNSIALEEDDRQLSYEELDTCSNCLAGILVEKGVKPGDRVGLYLDRSMELVTGMLAILKVGAVYVPMATVFPPPQITYIVRNAGLEIVITGRDGHDNLGKVTSVPISTKELLQNSEPERDGRELNKGSAEDPAYVIYTSGSTGEPKGVIIPHRGIVRLVRGQHYADFSRERFLVLASPAFDASTFEIWGPLLNGGTCIISRSRYPNLNELASLINKKGVTCMWLTSGLFNLIVDTQLDLLKPVNHVLTGGEALSPKHVCKALEELPNLKLTNGYGPTETTTFACTHLIENQNVENSVPIGRPIAHSTAYILDKHMKQVEAGVAGELCLGGDGLAIGYLNDPDLTKEKFVPNPFTGKVGDRMYRTGDRCRYLPDGNIEFLGRFDNQVKVRGFRLELGEVEVAMSTHPRVSRCVALAVDEAGGTKQVVAYFVATDTSHPPDSSDLNSYLLERVPNYAIPSLFIPLETLPLTPNGKINVDELKTISIVRQKTDSSRKPQTVEQKKLLEIWERIFDRHDISCDDSFFELGGHSLMATRMVSEIERSMGQRVPISALFECQTIREMSERLMKDSGFRGQQSLVYLQPLGNLNPLYCIHGWGGDVYGFLNLARALAPDRPVYGLQAVGLDDQMTRHRSVEEMAQHYYQQISANRVKGPYNLIGYSAGGWIAYAVAQLFVENGKSVNLYMLDTTMSCKIPYALYALIKGIRIISRLPYHIRHWINSPFSEKLPYLKSRYDWFMINLFRKHADAAEFEKPEAYETEVSPDLKDYFAEVASLYRPDRYNGNLTLFAPRGSPGYARLFWKYMIKGKVEVHFVDGDHLGLIDRHHIGNFVKLFRELLAGRE